MKEQIIRSTGLVVSSAVLGGCLVWFFTPNPKPEDTGEWKSTGDGKTIVNSKTGELRLARNGMNVEDAEELAELRESLYAQKEELARKDREVDAHLRRLAAQIQANNERHIAETQKHREYGFNEIIEVAK